MWWPVALVVVLVAVNGGAARVISVPGSPDGRAAPGSDAVPVAASRVVGDTHVPASWTAHRQVPSLDLDHWVYAVERVLDAVIVQGNAVVVVRDTPGAETGVLSEVDRHRVDVVATAALRVASSDGRVVLAYSTDTVNPFVSLSRYFHAPRVSGASSNGSGRHFVVAPAQHAAAPSGSTPSSAPGYVVRLLPDLDTVTEAEAAIRRVVASPQPAWSAPHRPRTRPCDHGFSVYVYPDDGSFALTEYYAAVLQVVRSQPYVTLNPEHACVFVPPFDTTPLPQRFIRGGFASFGNGEPVTEALQRLPHWNNGTNHVVLDWTDSRALYFDAGNAVVWKTGYDARHYRHGHDIAFPLFPNVAVDPAHRQRPNFHETRDVLVSFKGTLWGDNLGSPPFDVRRELLRLHNGRDIVIVDRAAPAADDVDYRDLLARSQFGLVPRGGGLHSYRFVEVLASGAIPVVMADDWVLPFSELLDADAFTVQVRERDAASLPHVLRSIPRQRVRQLAANALAAYETCFYNPVSTAFAVMRARLGA